MLNNAVLCLQNLVLSTCNIQMSGHNCQDRQVDYYESFALIFILIRHIVLVCKSKHVLGWNVPSADTVGEQCCLFIYFSGCSRLCIRPTIKINRVTQWNKLLHLLSIGRDGCHKSVYIPKTNWQLDPVLVGSGLVCTNAVV